MHISDWISDVCSSDLSGMRGMDWLAQILFAVNTGRYLLLWGLFLLRLVRHRRAFLDDLADHLRGPGFFPLVVACSVLQSDECLVGKEGGSTCRSLCVPLP